MTGKVLFYSIAASAGGFLFGFDTAVINGAVGAIEEVFEISTFLLGMIVAAALFGAAVGASICGYLADWWGRPRVMLIAAVFFFGSALGSGLATSGTEMAIWRFIGGIAVGIASVIGPLYIAEISPSAVRGRLTSFQQMSIVLGIFAALLANASIANALGGADATGWLNLPAWRWMLLAGILPAAVYGSLALLLPESPRYLVSRGKTAKATTLLASLHKISATEAVDQTAAIARTTGSGDRARFGELVSRRTGFLPIVWVGIGLAALQALVGIDVIFYYSTSLWQSVGFEESDAFALSTFTSVVNVLATIVAIFFVDKVGRRRLLKIGSAGMAVSLALTTIGFTQATIVDGTPQFTNTWGPLTLVAVNLFVIFFAISWGPVIWVLIGEMFPNRIRALAASAAAGANWAAGIIVNLTFPSLRDVSLPMSYGIYTAFAILSFIFVHRFVPETASKSLEDMSSDLENIPGGNS
ncbi:SP family sugar:H+ symporter-like MFS transporter [Pseudarthrobacter sp. PvP004]|nr:SP family sugar:H+ symporter-like MFS transporter [Pseudarthrobacter sp. PvP004]